MAFGKRRREQAAAQTWKEETAELGDMIEAARTFTGTAPSEVQGLPINLRPDERVFAVVSPVALFEPRVMGGHWQGASSGVSVRVPGTRSMRYRIGQTKGQYVRGSETPTKLDTGTVAVTGQRAVFVGPLHNREWQWAKCLAIQHRDDLDWTVISVSNRQKASGLVYGHDVAKTLRFRLDLAFAVFSRTTDQLVAELQEDYDLHLSRAPNGASRVADVPAPAPRTAQAPPPSPAVQAAWYPDPSGRHQYRYHDGTRWTPHVSDAGVAAVDQP